MLLDLRRAAPASPATISRPLHHRHVAQAAELEREQRQRDHLARERLGRRDADLRAGVQVDAAVGLARDRRADDVHDARASRAPRRFASRIAASVSAVSPDCEITMHSVSSFDDRVAVAELRRVLDLDRDARELLDHVLADQRRVPARAAGGDDDAVERSRSSSVGEVEAAELRRALLVERGGRASRSRSSAAARRSP